jgi:hypothetical protein
MPKYEVIDFDGYIAWTRRGDGAYAVDPLYEEKFLEFYNEIQSNKE